MNQYSLAVIIPNYNKGVYISRCVESVINQTRIPDEIVVVDDCSTDDSVDIICKLQDIYSRIRLVQLNSNKGVSAARNLGANSTNCNYITFLDSDDVYYNSKKLENEMSLIEEYAERGIDIVAYSPIVVIDEFDKVIRTPPRNPFWFNTGDCYFRFLSNYKSETLPRDFCMRKNMFYEVGGYSFYKNFYEDLDLVIRLSHEYYFYCTYEYGTGYRQLPGGLSKRPKVDHKDTLKEIRNHYLSDEVFLVKIASILVGGLWRFVSKTLRIINRYTH